MNVQAAMFGISLLACSFVAAADSWDRPIQWAVVSSTANYIARVVPGMRDENPPKATIYRLEGEEYLKIAHFPLRNPNSPVAIAITKLGVLITLDNWADMGHGAVVALYKLDGTLIREYTLSQLFKDTSKFRETTTSIWWRCLPQAQETLSGAIEVNTHAGRLTFDPQNGSFQLARERVCADER